MIRPARPRPGPARAGQVRAAAGRNGRVAAGAAGGAAGASMRRVRGPGRARLCAADPRAGSLGQARETGGGAQSARPAGPAGPGVLAVVPAQAVPCAATASQVPALVDLNIKDWLQGPGGKARAGQQGLQRCSPARQPPDRRRPRRRARRPRLRCCTGRVRVRNPLRFAGGALRERARGGEGGDMTRHGWGQTQLVFLHDEGNTQASGCRRRCGAAGRSN